MKKVLIISYYYPPIADVGGQRALALSKYLKEFGWEPYVLTVKNPDKFFCKMGEEKPPEGINVFYTLSLFNLSWILWKANGLLARILKFFGMKLKAPFILDLFSVPDLFIGWIPLAFFKGLSLIEKHDIDVILASCRPISCGVIGYLIKCVTKKPFLLDLRDPLFSTFASINQTYYKLLPTFALIKAIEKYLLLAANSIIVVTNKMKKNYVDHYPFLDGKTHVIYNGFFDDYFQLNPKGFDKFTIVSVGNFYHYSIAPEPFFEAIRMMIEESIGFEKNAQVLYVGEAGDWLKNIIQKYDLKDLVQLMGYVERQKSIEYICKASLLLLRVVRGALGTKIFEGLAAGTPMLVLTDEEEAEDLVIKYGHNSYCVRPDDILEIKNSIRDVYDKWVSNKLIKQRNTEYYNTFNRRNLVRESSKILDSLL